MVPEAPPEPTENGLVPNADGEHSTGADWDGYTVDRGGEHHPDREARRTNDDPRRRREPGGRRSGDDEQHGADSDSRRETTAARGSMTPPNVSDQEFRIRPAIEDDRLPLAVLFAAVAEERDGIATEPPVDIEERAATWKIEGVFVAVAATSIVGSVHVDVSRHGYAEVAMAVAREWRGRGVGSALLAAAVDWSRGQGVHKLSLAVFARNAAAIALYRKFGFVEEGRRVQQYRRASGELWDAIDMGLLL